MADQPTDLDRLVRLHGLMIANAGGDHEIDCDEDFRIAMKENLPALAAELRALRAQAEADGIVRTAVVDALAEAGCSGAGVQEHVGDAIGQLRALRAENGDLRQDASDRGFSMMQQRLDEQEESMCAMRVELDALLAELEGVKHERSILQHRLRVISASVDEVVDKLRFGVGEFGSEACSIFLALMEMHGLAKREQARGGA